MLWWLLVFIPFCVAGPTPKNSDDDTVPIYQVCSGVQCKDGYICAVNNLGPSCFAHCVPGGEITCNNVDCFPEQTCINEEVVCVTAPCYPVPQCIPFGNNNGDGYGVPNKPIMCKRPPQDAYPVKPPPYKPATPSHPSKPVNVETSPSYPSSPNDGLVPTWKACDGVKCKQPGYVCAINIFGPSCIAHCSEGGDYTCDNVDCKPGQSCVNQEVICVTTPCYPVPVCISTGKGPSDNSAIPDKCKAGETDAYEIHEKPPSYGNTPPPRPPGYGTGTTSAPPGSCTPPILPCPLGRICVQSSDGSKSCVEVPPDTTPSPPGTCKPPLPPCAPGRICVRSPDGSQSCVEVPPDTTPPPPACYPPCKTGYHCTVTVVGNVCIPGEACTPPLPPCVVGRVCTMATDGTKSCVDIPGFTSPTEGTTTEPTTPPTLTCANALCMVGYHCVETPTGPNCVEDNCGENEYWANCGNQCEGRCIDMCFIRPCLDICNPGACACQPNFWRHEKTGKCVACEDCGGGDVYPTPPPSYGTGTTSEPTNTCKNVKCSAGFHCVDQPSGPVCVPDNCGPNEILNPCSNLCEGKCASAFGTPPPCPKLCKGPTCACGDGFYRNDKNQCVTKEECKKGGKGEYPTPTPGTPPPYVPGPPSGVCNILCIIGTHCVVTPSGPQCIPGAACTPPLPPCAFGLYCSMKPDGSKTCLPPISGNTYKNSDAAIPSTKKPPGVNPCATVLCTTPSTCVVDGDEARCITPMISENPYI